MTPNQIRKIDLYLGIPICFLLTLFRKIKETIFGSIESEISEVLKKKKILFIKFIEQGATVLAYDALLTAIEKVGRENVYFCVFRSNLPVLKIMNIIPDTNIFIVEDKTFWGFTKSILKIIKETRKNKIDVAVDMEFFSRFSAIFSYLTGANTRVGLHRFNAELPYRGDLMTLRINYNPYIHVSQYYRMLVDVLFSNSVRTEIPHNKVKIVEKKDIRFPKYIPSKDSIVKITRKLETKFKNYDPEKNRIILLNPNASDLVPIRKWEIKNFIDLARLILNQWDDVYIVFTGTFLEKKEIDVVISNINSSRTSSLAGETEFNELLELYSISSLLVTNDSGPAHFAVLTLIPTVVLFGPETPLLFGPLSEKTYIIYKNLACSPCVSVFNHRFSPCDNNLCMKSITVEEVFNVCKNILNGKT
jgi:ADP-heptose:LPS heptosyltransferase